MAGAKKIIKDLFKKAHIEVGGNNPWDIQVHNEAFYKRLLVGGSLALGESYMDGWWDVEKLDEFVNRLLRRDVNKKIPLSVNVKLLTLKSWLLNLQSTSRAKQVVKEHYDLGNDLYMSFLDPYNQYTCGYFKGTTDLNEAQEKKLELICAKLQLKSTDRVLDIGCGWGGFAKYASERYGCQVVGITISGEQLKYARKFTDGLQVEIREQDYRNVDDGPFDKIVSIGMIEHVGYKNYRTYMEKVRELLADDGLFLLHTIGSNESERVGDPWVDKYIFPNGMLPSITQIGKATEGLFVMEDWHNFGADYDKTLMAWWENFDRAWPELKKNEKYDDRFYRMWKYYLCTMAGVFRSRHSQLWQIIFSKRGIAGGIKRVS